MHKLTRIGLPLLAALGLLVPGGVAAADGPVALASFPWPPSCGNAVKSYDGGALACFNPTGEHLYLCDTAADGSHPEVRYQGNHDGSTWGLARNYAGAGQCVDINLTMAEDTFIRYTPQNWDGNRRMSDGPTTGWISARG
ncbi:hypothetical protein [Actinokineospora sp. NPDC004072]